MKTCYKNVLDVLFSFQLQPFCYHLHKICAPQSLCKIQVCLDSVNSFILHSFYILYLVCVSFFVNFLFCLVEVCSCFGYIKVWPFGYVVVCIAGRLRGCLAENIVYSVVELYAVGVHGLALLNHLFTRNVMSKLLTAQEMKMCKCLSLSRVCVCML